MATAALDQSTTGVVAPPSGRRFCRAPHVQQAEQAGTIMLFDGKKYFTLPNEVANDLWMFLAQPCSAEELIGGLYDRYEAPREVIAADVKAQLELLLRERLVTEVGPGGEPPLDSRPWWKLWKDRR